MMSKKLLFLLRLLSPVIFCKELLRMFFEAVIVRSPESEVYSPNISTSFLSRSSPSRSPMILPSGPMRNVRGMNVTL